MMSTRFIGLLRYIYVIVMVSTPITLVVSDAANQNLGVISLFTGLLGKYFSYVGLKRASDLRTFIVDAADTTEYRKISMA